MIVLHSFNLINNCLIFVNTGNIGERLKALYDVICRGYASPLIRDISLLKRVVDHLLCAKLVTFYLWIKALIHRSYQQYQDVSKKVLTSFGGTCGDDL